jgi:twinkle protein
VDGKRSHGKSTILGQILLDAIEQGYAVCAYSGELIASVYQFWIDLQAAGPDHVGFTHDPIKRATVPTIPRDVQTAIHRWYYDKFFLHSKFGLAEETKILEIFDYAAKRYGCKMFLIDNLMTTVVDEGQDSNYYRAQAKFIQRLADFAHIHNAHVHLVSHPRKTRENLDMNDVSGAGEITNRADNVFVMQRLDEEEAIQEQCDSLLIVKKNRVHGQQDVEIQLNFEPKSKRFYMSSENPNRQYGWVLGDEEEEGRDVPWEI